MLMPVIDDVRAKAGRRPGTTSASPARAPPTTSPGQAFSFVMTLDGVGPWPPIQESHVEMDGAWALYEAWVKLQLGEHRHRARLLLRQVVARPAPRGADAASSTRTPSAPLWPDAISLAALQARALLDAGQGDRGATWPRSRPAAGATPLDNPNAQLAWDRSVDELLAEPPIVDPLRKHDCPPITDGACRGDPRRRRRAPASCCERPAWIRGIDHRDRADGPRRARPHRRRVVHALAGREGRRRAGGRSTWPSCTRRSPTRS